MAWKVAESDFWPLDKPSTGVKHHIVPGGRALWSLSLIMARVTQQLEVCPVQCDAGIADVVRCQLDFVVDLFTGLTADLA